MRAVRNLFRIFATIMLIGVVLGVGLWLGQSYSAGPVVLGVIVACIFIIRKAHREWETPIEEANVAHSSTSVAPEIHVDIDAPTVVAREKHSASRVYRDRIITGGEDYVIGRGESASLTFIDHDSTTNVGDKKIQGPIYVADLSKSRGDRYPAVIDPKLDADWRRSAEPLPYWPSYKNLSASQRGVYLDWLSSSRGAIDEVGYVFLYFYGFERYVFVNATDDQSDVRASRLRFILKELLRLQALFRDNRSFLGFSERLIEAIVLAHSPNSIDKLKRRCPLPDPVPLRYHLAQVAESGSTEPLDSDWVLQWLIHTGELRRSKQLRKYYAEFRSVFKAAYDTIEGITVPRNKSELHLEYQPASSGLETVRPFSATEGWCDPSVLVRPLKEVVSLLPEIKSAYRSLVKAKESGSAFKLLAAWPRGVALDSGKRTTQLAKTIHAFCESQAQPTIAALADIAGESVNDSVSKPQLRAFRNALAVCGWAMVPDPDLFPVTLKPQDKLRVYRGAAPLTLSETGEILSMNMRMGAAIALADGELQPEEVTYFAKLIKSHANTRERRYLRGYLRWQLSAPISGRGLKAQVDALDDPSRDEIANRLVDVAAADKRLPRAEILALEKYFVKLGLPKSLVIERLHQRASLAISPRESAAPTPRPTPAETEAPRGVILDRSAIAATQQATRKIQSVLDQIFADDEEAMSEVVEDTADAETESAHWHNGALNEDQHTFLKILTSRESWNRDDLQVHSKELGLMLEGTLEAINDAAFEHLGDQLVDLVDPIQIYRDVLPTPQE